MFLRVSFDLYNDRPPIQFFLITTHPLDAPKHVRTTKIHRFLFFVPFIKGHRRETFNGSLSKPSGEPGVRKELIGRSKS